MQPINQTVVNQPARTEPVERVIERVVETQRVVTEGGITETTLADRLNQLENKLRSLIFSQSSQQSAQTSAVYNVVAQSQRIDNLSNTTITNPTITGGSITASSIVGTISSAISTALATIDDLTSTNALDAKLSFASWYATTTDALGQGSTNRYYADSLVQTYLDGIAKGFLFSTTSADYHLSQSQGLAFSTTSANWFVSSSTTIPKTFTANTWNALNIFQSGLLSQASSTFTGAAFLNGGASSTALTISGSAWLPSISAGSLLRPMRQGS